MSHDELLASLATISLVGVIGWSIAFWLLRYVWRVLSELDLSRKKVALFRSELEGTELSLGLEKAQVAMLQRQYKEMTQLAYRRIEGALDPKTEKLLRLALHNTNENEAKNAALAVCRRLSGKL